MLQISVPEMSLKIRFSNYSHISLWPLSYRLNDNFGNAGLNCHVFHFMSFLFQAMSSVCQCLVARQYSVW